MINYEQWIPPRVYNPRVASNGEMVSCHEYCSLYFNSGWQSYEEHAVLKWFPLLHVAFPKVERSLSKIHAFNHDVSLSFIE